MRSTYSTHLSRLRWIGLFIALLALPPISGRAQSAANPGVVEVDDVSRYSQVLAISDTHGMFAHLTTLLGAAKVIDGAGRWTAGRTLLIVCGDSIDKGPESVPVLKLWMRLKDQAPTQGGRLIVLLGNHEAEFLKDPKRAKAVLFDAELARVGIQPEQLAAGKDKLGLGNFLRAMPLAARVGKYLFSHAGWYPQSMPWAVFVITAKRILTAGLYGDALVTGEHSILEEKEETPPGSSEPEKWYDDPLFVQQLEARVRAQKLYGVVFGHQPKAFRFRGEIGAIDDFRIIKIDTGMAPDADDSPGELLRFPHPSDLMRLAAPLADRLLADGHAAKIKVKKAASESQ